MTALPTLGTRLAEADDFIGVARLVCDGVRRAFDLNACAVALHRAGGGPAILVDNFGPEHDVYRLATVSAARYRDNPLYAAMREHGGPVGEHAIDMARLAELAPGMIEVLAHPFVVPLLDPSGLVGSIQIAARAACSPVLERDLVTMATQVSVRLAQLGVTALDATSRLTVRQYEVARLAARGGTNSEIAGDLAISPNTVKKLLKDVFQRLDIANRTELVVALTREGTTALHDVPVGVTRLGSVTVTRGA